MLAEVISCLSSSFLDRISSGQYVSNAIEYATGSQESDDDFL